MRVFLLLFSSLLFSAALHAQTPAATGLSPQVIVLGKSNRFGPVSTPSVPYTVDMTVLVALTASGLFQTDATERIYLVRGGKCQQIDYRAMHRDPSKDLPLQPWDVLLVNPPR